MANDLTLNKPEGNRAYRANEPPLAYRVADFCELIGISKATFWKYVKAGKIHVIRIGGRTLVPQPEAVRLSTEGVN